MQDLWIEKLGLEISEPLLEKRIDEKVLIFLSENIVFMGDM